jgi:hypothetical protein
MSDWLSAAGFAAVGVLVGFAYFALVRRTARQLAGGDIRVAGAVGAAGLRMALFAPGAVVAAMLSVFTLVGYMAGFVGVRFLALRRWKAS